MCSTSPSVPFWLIFAAAHVVLLATLLGSSVELVEYNEYGLNYDWATGQLYEGVLLPGRYLIGLTHNALRYPSVVQRVEYTDGELGWFTGDAASSQIQVRSRDGVAVIFYVDFEYRIIVSELYDTVTLFGRNYSSALVHIVSDTLRTVGSNFTVQNFYQEREMVGEAMRSAVATTIRRLGLLLEHFFFGLVELPAELNAKIESIEVERQNVLRQQYLRDAAIVEADTNVLRGQAQATIDVLGANAAAQSLLILQQARASALNTTVSMQRAVFDNMRTTLGLSASELLALRWARVMSQPRTGNLTLFMDAPVQNSGQW